MALQGRGHSPRGPRGTGQAQRVTPAWDGAGRKRTVRRRLQAPGSRPKRSSGLRHAQVAAQPGDRQGGGRRGRGVSVQRQGRKGAGRRPGALTEPTDAASGGPGREGLRVPQGGVLGGAGRGPVSGVWVRTAGYPAALSPDSDSGPGRQAAESRLGVSQHPSHTSQATPSRGTCLGPPDTFAGPGTGAWLSHASVSAFEKWA